MPKRRLSPVIADALFDDPAYRAMPVAAVGMVWRLVEHFHKTDCRPLPTSPAELQAIARAHINTWSRHRVAILELVARWIPVQESYHRHRQANRFTLQRFAAAGHAAQMRRKIERSAQALGGLASPMAYPTSPVRDPPDRPRPPPPEHRDRQKVTELAA